MQNLTDDSRHSTQLEGKKLKGYGARIAESISKVIASTLGVTEGIELDSERGILEEEISFDENGKQIEERKKREAMLIAEGQQKAIAKKSNVKVKAHKEHEKEDERDVNERREKPADEKEIIAEPEKRPSIGQELKLQQDIAKGKEQVVPEEQKIRESNLVKLEAVAAQQEALTPTPIDVSAASFLLGADNIKNMDQSLEIAAAKQQQQNSPIEAVNDLAKLILASILPTQLPDIREGKGQDGPQV